MADDKAPAWTVVGQTEDYGQNEQGAYVPGVRVTFRTANGSTGSVFIPAESYTADKARALVGAMAAQMAAVDHLSG
jgi:hypothetical protein